MPKCVAILLPLILMLSTCPLGRAQGPTIPQLIASGPYESTFSHEGGVPGFKDLVRESDLIVRCRILSKTSSLTSDQRHVFTDYSIKPIGVFKIPADKKLLSMTPDGNFRMRREGGTIRISGREFLERDQDFPEFVEGEQYILFLYKEKNNNQLMVYGGSQGAFRVVNGTVNHVARLGFHKEQIRNVDYHDFASKITKVVAEEKNPQAQP
jgi:hypothetical protein